MASADPYRRRHPDVEELMFGPNAAFTNGIHIPDVTPEEMDAIIATPVIYGELMPLVWKGQGKPATAFLPVAPFSAQSSEPKGNSDGND